MTIWLCLICLLYRRESNHRATISNRLLEFDKLCANYSWRSGGYMPGLFHLNLSANAKIEPATIVGVLI